MRRTMVQILSAAAVALLVAGCGSRGGQDAAAVRPKEAETGVLTMEGTVETAVEETLADSGETSAAERNETETPGAGEAAAVRNETAAETYTGAAAGVQASLLTEEEVRAIALNDAGVTEQEVSGIRIELDTEDGIQEYEVDFYVGNTEYDYDIDAMTGEIRSMDMDIDNDFHHTEHDGSYAGHHDASYTGTSGVAITEEEAKALALAKVPEASESDIRIHQNYDDGRLVYEGSIICNKREYDFEIDAESGKIVEWEEEID